MGPSTPWLCPARASSLVCSPGPKCGANLASTFTVLTSIVGTQNQNIHIYDVGTHKYITSLSGHISTVTCLLITPCERVLFSGSRDSTIQVGGGQLTRTADTTTACVCVCVCGGGGMRCDTTVFSASGGAAGMELGEHVANSVLAKTREVCECLGNVEGHPVLWI